MRLNEVSYTDAEPVEGYGPGFSALAARLLRAGSSPDRPGPSRGAGTTILRR